ncbi:MAG: GMC family oxidoreductase N-terminal domain-containing protein [Myxococcales bacterium]|nr:GMC family oxidoreductase N-terminal domain-containing protein [Myxococcales bacterium]
MVGAGTAGCAIAARVSEAGNKSVLVLEAGPDYHEAELPKDLSSGGRNSLFKHDWGYRHRPTPRSVRFPFPRGKVVGGSSAVNTCIALRGQPEDFDEWADLGLDEWSWEKCLPAFVRCERDLDFSDDFHGNDGPLPIRRHPKSEWSAWQAAFVEACQQLGYAYCPDSNAPGSAGVGPHAMNKIEGRRISVSEVYLTEEVRQREGFTLLSSVDVRRVLFENKRVVGVEVVMAGETRVLKAPTVVLCAGSTNTPGLLLHSGVGPSEQLAELGVAEIASNPAVGARLLDHPGTAIFFRPRWGAPTNRKDPLIQTVLRYSSTGSGPPDMLLQPGSKLAFPRVDFPLVSLMTALGKPKGHGRIYWKRGSRRPHFEPNFFSDASDRETGRAAMRIAFELSQTKPMRELATPFFPRRKTLASPERMWKWVRQVCDSGYHPSGTVPMGVDSDPTAATDQYGRVRGVEGLVVADTSLMPTITSSNTNLPTLMIGERFGEWLA